MARKARFLAVLALGAALAGCATAKPPTDPPDLGVLGDLGLQVYVRNETDREVVIVIDGAELLRVAAGQRVAGRQVIVPAREAYTIAARTTTGHELGSFRTDTEAGLGAPGFVKNLRCGDIWVWVGHDVAVGMIAPLPQELQEPCD